MLNYEDTVAKHWPEFAQNGKENIKIEDVLRHDAGLFKFHQELKLEDTYTENIKNNAIGKVIETDTPLWAEDSKRMYHAVNRDWITNEIFRRVDPKGRTMDEYKREELADILGGGITIAVKTDEEKALKQLADNQGTEASKANLLAGKEDKYVTKECGDAGFEPYIRHGKIIAEMFKADPRKGG